MQAVFADAFNGRASGDTGGQRWRDGRRLRERYRRGAEQRQGKCEQPRRGKGLVESGQKGISGSEVMGGGTDW